ncbi:MAG: hypothetical protein NWF00_04635 [Candidatus Bathyarchaeota archaeon]|nr:hypothetical protein [Candidatus Bathyarchaeota archaeon]
MKNTPHTNTNTDKSHKLKLPTLASQVRRAIVEILNLPTSELSGHQAFRRNKRLLAFWAVDCAEHILPFFEERHPKDDRPRKAIQTCRTWATTGKFKMAVIRGASLGSHAAARQRKLRRLAMPRAPQGKQ